MARGRNSKGDKDEPETGSLEVGMLCKSSFNDNELDSYLRQGEIKASEKPPVPPQILWVGDCTIATFGNFSASTGKAKSKKTFNITAMVAAAVTNTTVLNYRASLPEGKRMILYFDTEQSKFHCHNVIERIYRLAGLSLNKEDKRIRFYGLREFTPSLRIALIDYALRTFEGVGLVIIDGLRDLMYDINNAKESTDVMTMLMAWTSKYNLHIHCVLHLNKNDNNTRGHIGTELENKAETVLIISKDKQDANISEVKPMHMRDKEFSSWAFYIDDNSLPVLDVGYHVTVVKPKDKPLTSLSDDVHTRVLQKVFGNEPPQKYLELVKALGASYAEEGYKRGDNAIKEMLKIFYERKLITKSKDGYHYHPIPRPQNKFMSLSLKGIYIINYDCP